MATREDIIRRAEKFELRGRWDKAIREYRRLLDAKVEDPRLLNRIGDLLSRTGELDEAGELFRQVAVYYEREGLLHKAIATNKKVHKLQPADATVVEKLCELYSLQGLHIEAKSHFLGLARLYSESGQNDRVLEVYRRLVDLEPGNHELRLNLADLLRREGKRPQAFAEYLRIGKLYTDKGNHREGVAALEKALVIDPENPEVVRRLVAYYIAQQQPARAETILRDGLGRAPQSTFLLLLQAEILVQAGRLGEAQEAYLRLLDIDADVSDGLAEMCQAALALPEGAGRRQFFERLHDKFIECARPARAAQALVELLPSEGYPIDLLQRIRDLVGRVEREESRLPLLAALAAGYRSQGNLDAEREVLEEILEIDPLRNQELLRLKQVQAALPSAAPSERPPFRGTTEELAAPEIELPAAPSTVPPFGELTVPTEPQPAPRVDLAAVAAQAAPIAPASAPPQEGQVELQLQSLEEEWNALTSSPPSAAGGDWGQAEAAAPELRELEPLSVPVDLAPEDLSFDWSVHDSAGCQPNGQSDPNLALLNLPEIIPEIESIEPSPTSAPGPGPSGAAAGVQPGLLSEEELSHELDVLNQESRRARSVPFSRVAAEAGREGRARVIHAAEAFTGEAGARRLAQRESLPPEERPSSGAATLAQGGGDHASCYELGMAFKEMDLIEDALQEFTLASQEPKLREAASKMAGICCMQSHRHAQAIEWFQCAQDACAEPSRRSELQQLIAKARELQRGKSGFKVSVLS